MSFFEVEVNDIIRTNPFTIDFSNFTSTGVLQYVNFQLDFISVWAIAPSNPLSSILVDTNFQNSTVHLDNTPNSSITLVDLTDIKDIHYYWEANSATQSIEKLIMPPGTASLTITLRNPETNDPIDVPNVFQRIYIRFHIIGL
jgi:hypothetical protein